MIKVVAIFGLIVAGVTITIFMAPAGPCDPVNNSKPPEFKSPKGAGLPDRNGLEDWGRKFKCILTKPLGSQTQSESSPSGSLEPGLSQVKDSQLGSSLSAIFKFNSRDESRATQLKLESFKYKDNPAKKFNPYLPIKIELESAGKLVWQGEVSASDCNDELEIPVCEVNDYVSNQSWWKQGVKLRAYDTNGNRVAYLDYIR